MPSAQAETGYPAWMLSRSELLSRPLEHAYAIDPHNPVEIDDAIKVESLTACEKRVSVFISDIGLIKDETRAIEKARQKGWTRYYDDDDHTTMFEDEIWRNLGLDQRIHNLGAPAVKIAFSFMPEQGIYGDVEFSKVRLKTDCLSYKTADKMINDHRPELIDLLITSAEMADNFNFSSAVKDSSQAKKLVARFMVMTNFVVAETIELEGMPWLFRSHGLDALKQCRMLSDDDRQIFISMMKAIYQVDPSKHEGLGLAPYCHITSGLRRFADTANALNLDALIEKKDPYYDYKEMNAISDDIITIYRKEIVRARKANLRQAA